MYSTFPGTFSNPPLSNFLFLFLFFWKACGNLLVNRIRVIYLCIIFTANVILARGVVCVSLERANWRGWVNGSEDVYCEKLSRCVNAKFMCF